MQEKDEEDENEEDEQEDEKAPRVTVDDVMDANPRIAVQLNSFEGNLGSDGKIRTSTRMCIL